MPSDVGNDTQPWFASKAALGRIGDPASVSGGSVDTSRIFDTTVAVPGSRLYPWLKRAMDLTLSVAALIVLSPLLLLIALVIKADSSGPVIYRQERVGWDWRRRKATTFRVCKYRSMVDNCDQTVHERLVQEWVRTRKGSGDGRESVKLTNDPRITRVGRFLRQTSIDELPQLWNVVKGEMSLVGPRPVPLYEVAEYEAWHRRRLEALPGITGPWQVKGRGLTSVDDMARMDIDYIEHQSLRLDIELMLRTIPVVLSRRGAC